MQVEHANHLSARAKKLKIADKITNLRDITLDPPDWWTHYRIVEYLDWSEQVVNGLRGVNADLESLFYKTLAEARNKYVNN